MALFMPGGIIAQKGLFHQYDRFYTRVNRTCLNSQKRSSTLAEQFVKMSDSAKSLRYVDVGRRTAFVY